MNPKLRDLQIQAFAECKTFEDGQFRTDEVFERFAELIVRECAEAVENMANDEDSDLYFWAIQNASQKIKEHFGVEE